MADKNIKSDDVFRSNDCFALGRQMAIEYYACGATAFLDETRVEAALLKAAKESGATVISASFHKFHPQGISGVVVIAESHFTIHAWPEHDYAAVDIFTCGDNIDLEVAVQSMKDSFESENVVISSDQNRGLISKPFEQQKIGEIIRNSNICPISWKKEYERKNPWGILASFDIYEIDPDMISDTGHIERFVHDLLDIMEIKPHEDCRIVHFMGNEQIQGFSMTPLIGTSSVSCHFAHGSRTLYLDVSSCKFYDPREAAELAMSFFRGRHYKMHIALRQ